MHHPPDDLLAAYAAGTSREGEALLVAAHATLCPRCRAEIGGLEAVGGAVLDRASPVEVGAGALGAMLARLDDPVAAPVPLPPADGVLPAPIRAYTGPLSQVAWTSWVGGVRYADLAIPTPGLPVRLMRFDPGFHIPKHDHGGVERTLVLTGWFDDDEGRFTRGDVSVRHPDRSHDARIGDEVCVALTVNDRSIRPHGLKARLAVLHTPM